MREKFRKKRKGALIKGVIKLNHAVKEDPERFFSKDS